ncbi:MAG: undecaprenyl-diphosphatase UppP [Minisyncoccia bacterium]
MSIFHAIILGIVEGATEFIPVSSSGHLILAHKMFNIQGINDLGVDAIFQFATILAVLVYFWSDLWHLMMVFIRMCMKKIVADEDKIMIYAIIVGTIPAVIFGLFLEKYMETIFRSSQLVAWTLIIGALVMYLAERYAKQNKTLTTNKGFIIGLFQTLALVPGVSRSGATISGGLFSGLTRESATKFSFLLSFPIIVGAGLKSFLDVYKTGEIATIGSLPLGIGFLVSFFVGLASIHFLIQYLKTHKLDIFIWYRVVLAVLIFVFL